MSQRLKLAEIFDKNSAVILTMVGIIIAYIIVIAGAVKEHNEDAVLEIDHHTTHTYCVDDKPLDCFHSASNTLSCNWVKYNDNLGECK